MTLLTKLFQFVLLITKKYNIDESHGISHSMNVLNFANGIYKHEIINDPSIKDFEKIIYVSAVLHDMCDKKYMNEEEGIKQIEEFLSNKLEPYEIDITKKIVTTMSYSTVKKYGFPELKEYMPAYHIVREADLLSAYDFDRCMIYNMNMKSGNFDDSISEANSLFTNRVLRHNDDGLFTTEYSKMNYLELHNNAIMRMNFWNGMRSSNVFNK
jgi:HD superfamily phosphodiesterase